jgi:hypothetical protein
VRDGRRARPDDRGSVLLLFPAAFLIVLVLGAIAIDAAAAFLRQRELATAAAAAANDGIALAVEGSLARGDEQIEIDPVVLQSSILESLDRRGVLDTLTEPPIIRVVAADRVEVMLVGRADYVIAPALPGGRDGTTVRATATARLVIDDG